MRIVSRESILRKLGLELKALTISNKKLERLSFESNSKPVLIGSLCPITNDRQSYNVMVSQTDLGQDFISAITWLPDNLLPKFVMSTPNTKQLSVEGSLFYMFLKKTPTGNYSGLTKEKQIKLLERSKVLRTNIQGSTVEETMIIVFPPKTKYVSSDFLNVFIEQKELKKIIIVKDGKVFKEVINEETTNNSI